jgi:hypothetical protein
MTLGAPVAAAAGRPRAPIADRFVSRHAQAHATYGTSARHVPEAPLPIDDPFASEHME